MEFEIAGSEPFGRVGRIDVSVVMPVHNSSAYLAEAIESILSQTLSTFELIVVDDASTDNSAELVATYAAEDRRIRQIRQTTNRGNYPCRNAGMAVAQGRYVAVMDADDIAMPDRLERQVAYLDAHPECVMIGSQALLIDPEGAPLGLKDGVLLHHDEIDAALLNGRWAVVHPAVMIRKKAVEQVGGYREHFRTCGDHDLYLRLAEKGRIANLPDPLVYYRQHTESLTRKQADQKRNLAIITRDARRRRGLPVENEEDLPTVMPIRQITRRERAHLHYIWADLAARSGYTRTRLKHLVRWVAIDPSAPARLVTRRLRQRLAPGTFLPFPSPRQTVGNLH